MDAAAFVRQFLVSWISVLDSAPDLDLISQLPAILEGLLYFLSDPNKVRQQAPAPAASALPQR